MYEGALLSGFFEDQHIHKACVGIAEEGGRVLTRRTKEWTPVRTGRLRESFREKLLVIHRSVHGMAYETGTESNVEYAPYIEHGWGLYGEHHQAYIIRPRRPGGWLSWIDEETGRRVFARQVLHPGAPGAHMIAIGAMATEAEFDVFAEPHLAVWAHEQPKNRTFVVIRGRL